MSEPTPRLESAIRNFLAPHLRQDGFTGSGRTFRRVVHDWIQVVYVQGSRYGEKFAINLGVHPLKVPDVLGNEPDPKKMTEALCEFRRRLAESGQDQWWKHGESQSSMDAAVTSAADVYVRFGRPLLARMAPPISPIEALSPEDFASNNFNFHGFGSTKVCMALLLARLRKAQGKLSESRAFAAQGLAVLGSATGLRPELERLSSSSQDSD